MNEVAVTGIDSQNRHNHNCNTQKPELILGRCVLCREFEVNPVQCFTTDRIKLKKKKI